MSNKNNVNCSFGLFDIAFVVLLILKLTRVIDSVSWWWVCSPLLIEAGLVIFVLAIAGAAWLWSEL